MNIFEQVQALNLLTGQYIVVGSGVMSAHGIRAHQDVDLLVTPSLYQDLEDRGWQVRQINPSLEVVTFDIFEASPDIVTLQNYQPDTMKLIQTADLINGVYFMKLSDLLNFKIALSREKDLQDIELIQKFLEKSGV